MRSLLLATAALFAISCGSAFALPGQVLVAQQAGPLAVLAPAEVPKAPAIVAAGMAACNLLSRAHRRAMVRAQICRPTLLH
jgi:hypothetical protein